MPGFTAEASLYKTNRRNQSAGTFLEIIEGILPAQPVRPWPVDVVYNLSDLDLTSPRTYGTVNPGDEDKFAACVANLRARGIKYSDAYGSCCRQFTHYDVCVLP